MMNTRLESGDRRERPNRSRFGEALSLEQERSRARNDVVAIVEDDCSVRKALGRLVKSAGLPVETFGSAEEFLQAGPGQESACLILDLRLPGMNGLALQDRLAADHRRMPIIFVSAHCDTRIRSQALQAGAFAFLGKPFKDDALINAIRSALSR
jgi:FixJ family two-component response regulator